MNKKKTTNISASYLANVGRVLAYAARRGNARNTIAACILRDLQELAFFAGYRVHNAPHSLAFAHARALYLLLVRDYMREAKV